MKRLKKTVHSKNTTRKKNNGGMTYIELLVALSLLVLVVTMFSPMLLRSYDSLYKAGEMTEFAYDARSKIEEGLSIRENDNFYNIQTNFEKLSDTVSIKARQIISSVNGLETLYGGARGRIKVVSDSVVSDNQDAQVVRLLVTNLDRDKYTFKRAASATVAQNPGDGEVLFYVCSVFNESVQLEYTFTEVAETNFLDIFIKDINVTKGPIKFYAYFKDDFGVIKKAETYVYIDPADMMFVGDSDSQDYFTSAGVDAEKGTFFIAGRQMATAPIGGEMLNDVEWVGTENDSTILDGYYLMCGENSVVRRLWRARDSSKSANITYKTTAINGNAYFQYDWKGDFTDKYNYAVRSGATSEAGSFGSSSTSGTSEAKKDQYGLNGSSFVYYFNGFGNTGWSGSDNRYKHTKRISYIQYADKTTASKKFDLSEANTQGLVGTIKKYNWLAAGDHRGLEHQGGSKYIVVFDLNNKQWGTLHFKDNWFSTDEYYLEDNKAVSSNGFWIPGFNCEKYTSSEAFYSRTAYYSGDTQWDSTTETKSTGNEEKVAYLQMKAYNNFNAKLMNDTEDDPAGAVSGVHNPVNLTSCNALPGKTGGDTLYLGTTQANAIINQTNSYNIETNDDTYDRDMGLLTGHVLIGSNSGLKMNSYEQVVDNPGKQCYAPYVTPNLNEAINKFTDSTDTSNWSVKDAEFTMGYASDLYTMYNNLSADDSKPLEACYRASNGYTADTKNDTIRSNIWFTREFYNVTESDSYEKSIVACGYNVSGFTRPKYNEQYLINTSISFNAFAYEYSGGIKNRTTAQNEEALKKAAAAGWVYLWNDSANRYTYQYSTGNERWGTCGNSSYRFYYPDADVGADEKFWVKLPKGCVASTELEKITNDGVLSVYNEGDDTFTPIYYYKAPNKQSIRFNCVSAFGISDNVVGAAIGLSNGELILARIPYNNGKLVTTTLTSASCSTFDAVPEISEITAIKNLQYDITGDGTPENLIVAGGKRAEGKKFILRLSDINDTSKHYKVLLDEGTSMVKVTDIAVVNGYLYVSAIENRNGGQKGVIYAVDIKYIKDINGKANNASTESYIKLTYKDVDGSVKNAFKKVTSYYTNFAVDIDDGVVIGSGSSTELPVINSIAAKAE